MHSVGLVGKEGKALRVVRGENEGEGGVRVFSSQAMLRKKWRETHEVSYP